MIASALALLTAARSRVALYLGGVVAVIATLGMVLFAGRRQGRDAERNRALHQTIENAENAHAARRDADRDPDPAGRLRQDWRRD